MLTHDQGGERSSTCSVWDIRSQSSIMMSKGAIKKCKRGQRHFNLHICFTKTVKSNYACLSRIRTKIVDPYNKIVARITQLARLQVRLYHTLHDDCVTLTILWLCVNQSVSHFNFRRNRQFFACLLCQTSLLYIWCKAFPKPTEKSTLCRRDVEHLPICRQDICFGQSSKLLCAWLNEHRCLASNAGLQLSCLHRGKSWLNIDETVAVKRSVCFWGLSPGLMAQYGSDFLHVCITSFSLWPEPSLWAGCDSSSSQSLEKPRPLFVILLMSTPQYLSPNSVQINENEHLIVSINWNPGHIAFVCSLCVSAASLVDSNRLACFRILIYCPHLWLVK